MNQKGQIVTPYRILIFSVKSLREKLDDSTCLGPKLFRKEVMLQPANLSQQQKVLMFFKTLNQTVIIC